jgi:hypothetical protein
MIQGTDRKLRGVQISGSATTLLFSFLFILVENCFVDPQVAELDSDSQSSKP